MQVQVQLLVHGEELEQVQVQAQAQMQMQMQRLLLALAAGSQGLIHSFPFCTMVTTDAEWLDLLFVGRREWEEREEGYTLDLK